MLIINAPCSFREYPFYLTKNDWPWIIGAILIGGIAAHIVLMFSLKNTPASTVPFAEFEGVATTVIAVVVF